MRRNVGIAAIIAGTLAAAGVARSQTVPTPAAGIALYDAVYDRWRALPRDPFATYEQTVRIVRKGRTVVRHDRVAIRERDHLCRIVGVPLDAADRPDASKLTDRCFSTDAAFTLVPQDANDATGPLPVDVATPEPDATTGPRTIARVTTRVRPYEVTLVGDETVDGVATTHLALVPYRDPASHLVRDLWIDRATNGVVRLHGVASLAARFASVDFVADYAEDARSQALRTVSGYAKAQLLLLRVGADFAFAIDDVAHPETLPEATFARRPSKP